MIFEEKPLIKNIKCLGRLNKDQLKGGNLQEFQKKLWKDFQDDYNATFVIVRSNMDKKFGFFIKE